MNMKPEALGYEDICARHSCDCNALPRRDFLLAVGLGTAGALGLSQRAVAGPFAAEDFAKLVPADKKLDADWIKSLFARGTRTVYRGTELEKIGMPVGGICAGMLYLGGDGKLWLWDIFNRVYDAGSGGPHYAHPLTPSSPLDQGFALQMTVGDKTQTRLLDRGGFADIRFTGEYPIGFVEYSDPDSPLSVSLEAFSPFIPLDAESSSLPATVMRFTVKNTSKDKVEAELGGWLENAVCLHSGRLGRLQRRNRLVRRPGVTFLECSAEAVPQRRQPAARVDIRFDDFEKGTYEGWTVTGTAFGKEPMERAKMPAYQGEIGSQGKRLVNTHNARQGEDVGQADAHVGTLTSKPFKIERHYITFLVGGGAHKGRTCVNLLIDDKVVDSATGRDNNYMQPHSFDVRRWAGRMARLQVVDNERGPWGNIGVDDIVFSDRPREAPYVLTEQFDYGTMGLALLDAVEGDRAVTALPDSKVPAGVFTRPTKIADEPATRPFGHKLTGSLTRKFILEPGAEANVTFVVAWHFPNIRLAPLPDLGGRSYGKRFQSALAVAEHLATNFERLSQQTRLWHDTWYDSTLPYWFLDRTFVNTSILASTTCYWFANGRFYGWEGVGCCAGTCTHVWQYAQAVARIFPQLERTTREKVDYGIAFHADSGAMDYRAEADRRVAVDGQAGTILRAYREHQMSADAAFLKRTWPRIKKSIAYLMRQDRDSDGLLEGEQYNTLDAPWYGEIAWISSLYLAAVRAGAAMAEEMNDAAFAMRCQTIAERGNKRLIERVFNGEYFIQRPDPKHPEAINSNDGCEIDQMLGQSWAWQVGLPRVLPAKETRSALQALWKYNFTPDIGPYRRGFTAIKGGRWYAMPGEGGLLMCTWPRGGAEKAAGKGNTGFVAYFNECMSGFEYQVAAHMIAEGLVQEGLAIVRTIHDRYHASRRNPFNEIECSDHYARAMASYGVFLTACGYEHHGPKGHLGFAPRLTPEDFRAPFTTADGWGTFTQKREGRIQKETIALKWGKLRMRTLAFAIAENVRPAKVKVTLKGKELACRHTTRDGRLLVTLDADVVLEAGQTLEITIH
jgi:non-lysosomal glucosylceramidase